MPDTQAAGQRRDGRPLLLMASGRGLLAHRVCVCAVRCDGVRRRKGDAEGMYPVDSNDRIRTMGVVVVLLEFSLGLTPQRKFFTRPPRTTLQRRRCAAVHTSLRLLW